MASLLISHYGRVVFSHHHNNHMKIKKLVAYFKLSAHYRSASFSFALLGERGAEKLRLPPKQFEHD